MRRLKVLISAHELSPGQGSECAEGWNLVTRIARYHDVTVLYARGSQFSPEAYETAIRQYYADHENGHNIQYIPVPQPETTLRIARLNKKLSGRTTGIGISYLYYIGYRLWQKRALITASSLIETCALSPEPYHLVHHLTQITYREPGYLWKLPLPFVWGPTGGVSAIPFAFYRHIGIRAAIYEGFRTIANRLTIRFNRRINQAIGKSSLMYAFSTEDQALFLSRGAKRVELMLDAGCEMQVAGCKMQVDPPHPLPPLPRSQAHGRGGALASRPVTNYLQPASGNRLRVLWCGQLIKRKALDILIKAIAGDAELMNSIQLTIVGDGPLRKRYESLIKKLLPETRNLKPETSFSFTGWLSRSEVFEYMKQSDVLVHTSYREATSNVIPEALSCGLPVICHDISGMSIAVTDECGIKIPLISYQKSIIGFREALQVASSRLHVTDFRSAALARAKELSWDSMAERIAADYGQISFKA